ncbi:hypothetical protein KEM55_002610 [Ascosphaera atra]|nr:hypothetical protein KEM55_002610 [Ascosphaera atra]
MASRAKKGWHSPGPSREASSEKQEEADGEREDAAKSEARLGAPSAGVLEDSGGAEGKRKWYRYLNPLRWQQVPPVPTEKRTTREYGANLLSQITFHWMAPLMTTFGWCTLIGPWK